MKAGDPFGPYMLEEPIGHGANAVVWRATGPEGAVALKVLEVPGDLARVRFLSEFEAQRQVDHPNVIRVHDLVEHEGRLGMVCELVHGEDLQTLIASGLHPEDALSVFAGILHGLGAAHARGLVHRDLKPTNILMSGGRASIPKIGDFGSVKSEDGNRVTQQGMVLGTLRYMSPEQLMDAREVDARADLFSAGCILFEMITGKPCFEGAHRVALVNAVRTGRHTPFPETMAPEVVDVIRSLISGDPNARPSSARAVLEALELPLEPTPDLALVDDSQAQGSSLRSLALVAALVGVLLAGLACLLT